MLNVVHWDVTPEIIDGWRTPNYYGLLFVTGLILGYYTIKAMYKKAKMPEDTLEKLVLYMIVATIVGARLGHVFFYDWAEYKDNLIDIFKVWEGGLASHGGAIAIVIALIIYSKKVSKKPLLWIFDRIAAPIAIAGMFIRLGNLMNSEIVGKIANVPWGFKFYYHDCTFISHPEGCTWDMIPVRHPTQIYEAIAYLSIFIVLMYMFWKRNAWMRQGMLFGTFLILLFGARFYIEFFKVGQAARDAALTINTGQWLSVPFVIAGIIILIRALKMEPKED